MLIDLTKKNKGYMKGSTLSNKKVKNLKAAKEQDDLGESLPCRGNCKCKGPKGRLLLADSRKSQEARVLE